MQTSPRDIFWAPVGDLGLEHCRLTMGASRQLAEGSILRVLDDTAYRIGYKVIADGTWTFRRLEISVTDGRSLTLESNEDGAWRSNGENAPELAGCIDIDIQVTPFTNSLPIRRIDFEPEVPVPLKVAYIPLPSLEPRVVEQRYTRQDDGRYLYEGLFRDFQAPLQVDEDGVVIDYPDTFQRVYPS